jgi:predicted metal-binding membrane protein
VSSCAGIRRIADTVAPAHFLPRYWRTGSLGAFRVGCCRILMGLQFVGGVMNPLWIAAIAIFVLLEKTIPFGDVAEGSRAPR